MNNMIRNIIAAFLMTIGCAAASAATLDLSGEGWRLDGTGADGKEKISLPMRVPGDVQSVLFDAGKLVDPFWGDNEKRTQWPGEHDWTISRAFDVPAKFLKENDSVILRLEDCDTFCTLTVNGETAGVTSNRFARYDFDVKRLLKPGRNTISGFFRSPESVAMELAKHYTDIPYHMANVKRNLSTGMPLIRKPGCHGGWDWGLAQMTVGFCGKVELLGAKAARIDYAYCDQDFAPDLSSVKVAVNVEAFAPKAGKVPFTVRLGDETKKVTRTLAAGENKFAVEFAIAKPRLWWPIGHGEQNLYPLSVASPDGTVTKEIGLRKLKLLAGSVNDKEVPFTFVINDRPIFAKGINWIPADAFESRQEAKYRPLLEACCAANMNMVRVWGGGQFERDSFYALCDKLGLMVFHDFMFGCSRNPADDWFLSLVEAETRHQVKRLRDVASIVIWAGDNECIGTAGGGHGGAGPKEDRERRVAHWRDCWRKRATVQAKWLAELDPTRAFWPSCPCDGFGDPGEHYNGYIKGDWHSYSWKYWLGPQPRFVSEYGFQSYPSHDTALLFVNPEDVDPAKPLFAYHQKSVYYGAKMLTEAQDTIFRKPDGGFSPEDKIYLSLNAQAWLLRQATENWRVQTPHCMGTIIWQLNDNWPVASWSLVEYGGKWKPSMYEAKRFFAPVAAFATGREKGFVSLSAVNDSPKAVNVQVRLKLMTFGGATLKEETFDTAVEPCKAVLLKKYHEAEFGDAEARKNRFLVIDIAADDSAVKTYQSCYFFGYPKDCNFEPAEVKMEAKEEKGQWIVTLSTDKPAFGVWVNASRIAGEFDDNHLTLLPGNPRTLVFKPLDGATRFADFVQSLTVRHVRQTYGEKPADRAPEAKKQVLGYQLDVSRCKVPKQEVIYRIVDILASLGYNHFQLYTEHTFAYKGHETVWKDSSPMTPEEVRALDDYCAKRGIELVPNQNSFGHMQRWLKHPEYSDISNSPRGGGGTLNPEDPRSLELVSGLYDQLLPCFRSKYLNVGCDETGLKNGRCKEAVEARGETQVYCDFLNKIYAEVAKRGHTMMFWGDIILRHPEFLPQLPKDVVCLDWGYEATHPFERQTAALEASGMDFIVCPGTSGWGSLFGRAENMLTNINNAVEAGNRHGAMGYLLADWGDGGHPQPWIISLPSIVYMARRVRGETPSRAEITADIDRICGAKCGEALFAYGDAYLKVGGRMKYKAELYYVLREGKRYKRAEGVTDESIAAALAQLELAKSLLNLDGAPDWVREDFALLDLLARAVKVKLAWPDNNNWKGFRERFEDEYRRLWLLQNRPGGLEESLDWQFCR